jgi:spermidine synthase
MKRNRFLHVVIYAAFFLSGAVGLAYEIVWTRQLSLLFGVSIYAVSAVLVAFMGGLGLGAEFFGRRLNRGLAPLRLYSIIEMGLGLYVILFPLWLSLLEKIYLAVHPGVEGASFFVIAIRFVLAVSVLAVPCVLMGGTLPALSRYFADYEKETGRAPGFLYAINTIGAMVGCIAAGFFMVEHFGLSNTLRIGAIINLLLGLTVWLYGREEGWQLSTESKKEKKGKQAATGFAGRQVLLVLFGVSGFCALALEVTWTRMLVLLLNNTTYAFALILSIFLLGIGAGSGVVSALKLDKPEKGAVLFGLFQIFIGFFAMMTLLLFAINGTLIEMVSVFISEDGLLSGLIPGGKTVASPLIFTLLTIFPCTFMMGAGFPVAVRAYATGGRSMGGDVGRLYGVNTLGCVLGSLLAGYILIPFAGVHNTLLIVSWVAIGAGFIVIFNWEKDRRIFIGAVIVLLLAPFTVFLLYSDISYLLSVQKLEPGSRVEYYEEGPSATVLVSVRDSGMTIGRKPVKRLWINGDPIAGSFRDALQLERLQAHIPLLLHPDPQKALVICFGTGSTAGATAVHNVKDVTAVDISPEVFNSGEMFAQGNLNVIKSEKFRRVEEDGRNFLLTTIRKFDFITSEPPPPSNAGIVSLYTEEYYRLCLKRLAKGGIVSQWIPLHHLSPEDFKMLVATFHSVFPHAVMWYTKWDAIMIGSTEEIVMDFQKVTERMKHPLVKASLLEIGIFNAHQLFSNFMMDREQIGEYIKGAQILTDDRPVVEFTSPRLLSKGLEVKGENLVEILKYRTPPKVNFANAKDGEEFASYFDSQSVFLKGRVELNYERRGKAAAEFDKALRLQKENTDARFAFITLNLEAINGAISTGKARPGIMMLADTVNLDIYGWFEPQLHFLYGMLLAMNNEDRGAEEEFMRALSMDNNYFLAAINLAGLYDTKLEMPKKAREFYLHALSLNPSTEEQIEIQKRLQSLPES